MTVNKFLTPRSICWGWKAWANFCQTGVLQHKTGVLFWLLSITVLPISKGPLLYKLCLSNFWEVFTWITLQILLLPISKAHFSSYVLRLWAHNAQCEICRNFLSLLRGRIYVKSPYLLLIDVQVIFTKYFSSVRKFLVFPHCAPKSRPSSF